MNAQTESHSTRIGIAIVEDRGRVLVGIRDLQTVLGGMHEFPGGKCLPGESPAECTLRECFEETGLRVDVIELLIHTHHTYPHGALDLYFHLCRPVSGKQNHLTGNFQWVPLSEIRQLNFPDGNRSAIDKLLDRGEQTDGVQRPA